MFDRILMFTKGGTIIQHADMKVNMNSQIWWNSWFIKVDWT